MSERMSPCERLRWARAFIYLGRYRDAIEQLELAVWDEESDRDRTPVYRSRLGRIGGCFMIGTYLFLAATIAGSLWVIRKLWNYDHDKTRHKD